jgi:2-oxoglutarate dehydrogenase complex dihydrolipoamide succinyltransferase (E2) component
MPKMGISVSEGTVLEWRKQAGDWVEADETIADVTTDKVDVEIPSPASGRLARIVAEVGETVPVGAPIAEIDLGAKPGQVHPDEREPAPSDERRATSDERQTNRAGFYSPVVRRIADKHEIDLARIEGTGIGGRVRKRDLLAFLESDGRSEPDRPVESGERRAAMSPMRQAIARHMVESRRTAAHCTTIVEVDMSKVVARRQALKETMERRGVRLTYLAFVARATVEALADHPVLNASVEGEEIVYHADVNLGIAVALDDGLIVPVIPRAQRLSLEGLAVEIAELAERARSKRLEPDEVHGGTFTITNPGQFGAVLATPIINQPQVAILDLEAVVKRPVVIEGEGGEDAIAVRPMTYLPMSWDHRALDGAQAARFLSQIKGRLETWERE